MPPQRNNERSRRDCRRSRGRRAAPDDARGAARKIEHTPETTRAFAIEVARARADDKCSDLVVLDVRNLSSLSDYIVVGSGTSDCHIYALLHQERRRDGGQADRGRGPAPTTARPGSSPTLSTSSCTSSSPTSAPATTHIEMLWGDAPRLEWERPDQLSRDRAGLGRTDTLANAIGSSRIRRWRLRSDAAATAPSHIRTVRVHLQPARVVAMPSAPRAAERMRRFTSHMWAMVCSTVSGPRPAKRHRPSTACRPVRAVSVHYNALLIRHGGSRREFVLRCVARRRNGVPSREEKDKSLAAVEGVLAAAVGAKLERTDCSVAIGGGIVGVMTGFAAGIYRRGIAWCSIPTTLLSMVDASIGGKTGCNLGVAGSLLRTWRASSTTRHGHLRHRDARHAPAA